ncbi:MAG: hypothetical protein H6621_05290 [Halobacteriovoraceae bacterium]|nr:hypothetical protein [Halobacteriovoraceae bacterium]
MKFLTCLFFMMSFNSYSMSSNVCSELVENSIKTLFEVVKEKDVEHLGALPDGFMYGGDSRSIKITKEKIEELQQSVVIVLDIEETSVMELGPSIRTFVEVNMEIEGEDVQTYWSVETTLETCLGTSNDFIWIEG